MRSLSTLVCALLPVCALGSAEAKSIRLSGSLTDGPRKPVVLTKVTPIQGREIAQANTGPGGTFAIRCDREITSLYTSTGFRKIERKGPWSQRATVDLQTGSKPDRIRAAMITSSSRTGRWPR